MGEVSPCDPLFPNAQPCCARSQPVSPTGDGGGSEQGGIHSTIQQWRPALRVLDASAGDAVTGCLVPIAIGTGERKYIPVGMTWPYALGLYRSVVMVLFVLRQNPVQQVAAELFGCSQYTVSRRLALLGPLLEQVLAEFVPRYLFRGSATGPPAFGSGMTSPLVVDDPGGVVSPGPEASTDR